MATSTTARWQGCLLFLLLLILQNNHVTAFTILQNPNVAIPVRSSAPNAERLSSVRLSMSELSSSLVVCNASFLVIGESTNVS